MPQPWPDPALAARALLATLPALIEHADAVGGPLKLAASGMRTALAEAQRLVGISDRSRPITSAGELMRRLGG